MKQFITQLLSWVILTLIITMSIYLIPYLIRLGWNHAENRTKKVCDMCFRDIKRFNDYNKDKK